MFELQWRRLRFRLNDWQIRRELVAQERKKPPKESNTDELTVDEMRQIINNLLSEDDTDDFDDDFLDNNEDETLSFDPATAILFYGEHGRRCNALTAWYYRRMIRQVAEKRLEQGTKTFFADYMEPFGLLALETLCEMKREGWDFSLYALQSGSIMKRRSYRIIPETNLELIYLGSNYDAVFSWFSGTDVILDAYAKSKYACTETGVGPNPGKRLEL